ncbi:uncharacterized protein TM35_000352020 [Trypanosoma theileri]|uniref:Uncharacterized protein n=1 Tax=Trypanosoma theileri TaxID=67003 RepID=A0A1X0NLP6_9TRYP|nr:uncharacterized protein TM35_000352020 [Trypanosoma theileri]ORC85458.1 hypothetical protein TM35_000352020 [Trypanosoma theileri]
MQGTSSSSQNALYERCLNGARAAKDEGNAALKDGKLRAAAFNYKKANLYLAEYIQDDNKLAGEGLVNALCKQRDSARRSLSPERLAELMELYAAVQNNLALVNLRLGRYPEGVRSATVVLSIPEHAANTKALLRRASCNLHLGNLEKAESDLDAVERHSQMTGAGPVDPAVVKLRAEIAEAKKEAERKQRDMCKRMFVS